MTARGTPAALLGQARQVLADAAASTTCPERFRLAHLAALRIAAAVLADRGRPAASRRRLVSVWTLLDVVAPELADWTRYFAAGAAPAGGDRGGRPGRGVRAARPTISCARPRTSCRWSRARSACSHRRSHPERCRLGRLGWARAQRAAAWWCRPIWSAHCSAQAIADDRDRRARLRRWQRTFAVPLAVAGADVTVVDISVDALATLRRRADEAGVGRPDPRRAGRCRGADATCSQRSSSTSSWPTGSSKWSTPLHTASPRSPARSATGGLLSVLVGNPVAAVLDTGPRPATWPEPRASSRLLARRGRCSARRPSNGCAPSTDWSSSSATASASSAIWCRARRSISPAPASTLADLEIECAQRSPFAEIAGRIHLLARKQ